MRNARLVLALVVATLAPIAACTQPTPGEADVLLPKLPPLPPGADDARFAALLIGRPVVHDGCVKVRDSTGGLRTVLWHPETGLEEREGKFFLRNTLSGKAYAFGEQLRGGGGEVPAANVAQQYPEIAARCGPPYWIGYLPYPIQTPPK